MDDLPDKNNRYILYEIIHLSRNLKKTDHLVKFYIHTYGQRMQSAGYIQKALNLFIAIESTQLFYIPRYEITYKFQTSRLRLYTAIVVSPFTHTHTRIVERKTMAKREIIKVVLLLPVLKRLTPRWC